MICFVCAVEEENAQEFLELVDAYLDLKIAGPICASALESWGLIASSFSDEELTAEAFVDTYGIFVLLQEVDSSS